MTKAKRKTTIPDDQKAALKEMHTSQVVLEVAFSVTAFLILTINIATAFPGYGILAFLGLGLASLTLLVFGIILTSSASRMRRLSEPLGTRAREFRPWLIIIWISLLASILLLMFNSPFREGEFVAANLFLIGFAIFVAVVAIITVLVKSQLLWRRFNRKKKSPLRLSLYGAVTLLLLVLAIFGTYTTDETVKFNTVTTTDANLELGQSEVRQVGKDGVRSVTHNLLFGVPISEDVSESVDQITANGSRKYQYMYCSNGSYQYYSAEEFKNPTTGFTHQSPDYCAQNGQGNQTTIADVPPAEKVIQQVPVYNNSYYRAPSSYTTTCNSYSFSNSITCRTY